MRGGARSAAANASESRALSSITSREWMVATARSYAVPSTKSESDCPRSSAARCSTFFVDLGKRALNVASAGCGFAREFIPSSIRATPTNCNTSVLIVLQFAIQVKRPAKRRPRYLPHFGGSAEPQHADLHLRYGSVWAGTERARPRTLPHRTLPVPSCKYCSRTIADFSRKPTAILSYTSASAIHG